MSSGKKRKESHTRGEGKKKGEEGGPGGTGPPSDRLTARKKRKRKNKCNFPNTESVVRKKEMERVRILFGFGGPPKRGVKWKVKHELTYMKNTFNLYEKGLEKWEGGKGKGVEVRGWGGTVQGSPPSVFLHPKEKRDLSKYIKVWKWEGRGLFKVVVNVSGVVMGNEGGG